MSPRVSLDAMEWRRIFCPCWVSNPGQPARNSSLYRLSCPGGSPNMTQDQQPLQHDVQSQVVILKIRKQENDFNSQNRKDATRHCSFHSIPSNLLNAVLPCLDKHYPTTLCAVAAFHSQSVTIGANNYWHHTLFTQINGKATQNAVFKIRVTTQEFIDSVTELSHTFCRCWCCYLTCI